MAAPQEPVSIFISYAHKDEIWLRELEAHMSLLKHQGLVSTWYDRLIIPGVDWAGTIDRRLEQASIILLLISADFLASNYCYQIEMQRALELHQTGTTQVIPVAVRPTIWKDAPFAHLQALPKDAKPISTWENQDEAFVSVVEGIRQAIQNKPSRSANEPDTTRLDEKSNVSASSSEISASHVVNQPTSLNQAIDRHHGSTPASPVERGSGLQFGEPFPDIWNVPRAHAAFFTGRTPVLEQLFKDFGLVDDAGIAFPQAVIGLGGMGKTQVAAEYAFRFRTNYQAVLWVQANTQENLVRDFRIIADFLKCAPSDIQDQANLVRMVHEWFRNQAAWLLIFDNADDPIVIDPFLPRSARGHILLTTRYAPIVRQAQALQLEALEADDGALCILRRAGILSPGRQLSAAPPASREDALQLAQRLRGFPLALEQAGAYINDTGCSVFEYLELYDTYRVELRERRYGPGMGGEYLESVASTWKVSRGRVERLCPAAAEILRLCAVLASETVVPISLLRQEAAKLGPVLGPVAADKFAFDDAIIFLRQHSLITRDVEPEIGRVTRLSIHSSMQEVLWDEMDEATQDLWVTRAVCIIAAALLTIPWSVLQAHARQCYRFIEQKQLSFPEARFLQQWVDQKDSEEKS